jgi:hypothetical protein
MFLGDLEVTINDAEDGDDGLLTIDYTVRNSSSGFNVPSDVPIPVYFWTHLDAETLVAPGDDPFTRDQVITAHGVEYVTGGLLAGEERTGTYLFNLADDEPYAQYDNGVAYAYVLPMHETAPQCVNACSDLPPPVGDNDWRDNLSLGFPWGAGLADLRIKALASYVHVQDFSRALVFDLVVEDELPEETTRVCYEIAPMLEWPSTYDYPRRACGDVEHGEDGYPDRVSLRLLFYTPPDTQGLAAFQIDPRNKRRELRESNNDSNVIRWKLN